MLSLTAARFAAPGAALEDLREHPRTAEAVLFVLAGWLCCLAGICIVSGRTIPWTSFCSAFFAGGALLLLLLSLKTAWLHALAQALGGRGRMSALFSLLSRALLPLHLFLPVALLTRGRMPLAVFFFWAFGLLWAARFGLRALRFNYGLSAARTLVAAFAPAAFVLLLMLAAAALVVGIVAVKALALLSHLS